MQYKYTKDCLNVVFLFHSYMGSTVVIHRTRILYRYGRLGDGYKESSELVATKPPWTIYNWKLLSFYTLYLFYMFRIIIVNLYSCACGHLKVDPVSKIDAILFPAVWIYVSSKVTFGFMLQRQ